MGFKARRWRAEAPPLGWKRGVQIRAQRGGAGSLPCGGRQLETLRGKRSKSRLSLASGDGRELKPPGGRRPDPDSAHAC